MNEGKHIVTGAFGYSGKYMAKRLLDEGKKVATLTNSADRANNFGNRLEVLPMNFNDHDQLVQSLQNTEVLYNTYWVRFNHKGFTYRDAVRNTFKLFEAAKAAKVKRIVHVSITNPTLDSPYEYFRGKARIEQALVQSGLSYCILRPAVLFGKEDILINNIAWTLRRLPVIGVFGNGNYRIQPIYVDDLAELAVACGKKTDNRILDATGPETFTYEELIRTIGSIIHKERPIIHVPAWFGYLCGLVLGKLVGDVLITKDEIDGLMADLLHTDSPSTGTTKLTDWARENASTLGLRYANELKRRMDRKAAYFEN